MNECMSESERERKQINNGKRNTIEILKTNERKYDLKNLITT